MLATVVGSMAATIAREAADARPAGRLASALIGSGASLLARRDRRGIGLALIVAGGLIVWREAARREVRPLKAATARPAVPPPGSASAAAA